MGISADKQNEQMANVINEMMANAQRAVFNKLAAIGEKAITLARDTKKPNTYLDQTGNLRSSIGYTIAYNGEILISSSFEVVKDGSQGASDGKQFAESFAKEHSDESYCLVLVAGMNYAYFVENGHSTKSGQQIKGRDVLSSAELLCEQLATKAFSKA